MVPGDDDGEDGDDVEEGRGAALGVSVEFAAELGEVSDVARPGLGDGERRHAKQQKCGGEREERDHEEHGCVNLGSVVSGVHWAQ